MRDCVLAELGRIESLFGTAPDMPLLRQLYERFLADPTAKRARDIAVVEMEIILDHRQFNSDGRKVMEELRLHLVNLRTATSGTLQELTERLERYLPAPRLSRQASPPNLEAAKADAAKDPGTRNV